MAGYKLKTHKGAAKRFDFTAKGKVKRQKAFASHLLTSKSASRMRRLTQICYANHTENEMLHKLMPYK